MNQDIERPVTDLKCERGRTNFCRMQEPAGGQQGHMVCQDHGEEAYGNCCEHGAEEHGSRQECAEQNYRTCQERGEEEHRGHHGHRQEESGHRREHKRECHRGCGRGLSYESDSLYSMMRACGHHLYVRSGREAGQGRILAILLNRKSMTQKELQDILRIQPGSVSEILTKLEEKGLIRRQRDEEDRRRSVIELTEAGHEAAVRQEQQEDGTATFAALSEQEQEELKKILAKLLESWK